RPARADAESGRVPPPLRDHADVPEPEATVPDPELVATVAGLPPDSPSLTVRIAELVAPLTAPAVRETVLALPVDDGELPSLRHRLAQFLYRRGESATDVADLLLRIPQSGEPWLAHTLEEAATQALRAGEPDPEHAARLLRHALTGPVEPARHCALTLRLSALDMLRSSEAGTRRLRESLRQADCHDPVAISQALGGALVAQGHVQTAIRILEETGRALDDEQLLAMVRVGVAGLTTQDPLRWEHAYKDLSELARVAPPSVEPMACTLLTLYEGGSGMIDMRTAADRVTARLNAPVHPLLRTGFASTGAAVLEWADLLDEARALVARDLPAPPELPDVTDQGHLNLLVVLATVERKSGRFPQLIAATTPLLRSVRDASIRLPYLRALTAHAWHELGYPERALRHLRALGEVPPHSSWNWDEVVCTRARILLDSGDAEQALTSYLECGARTSTRLFVNPVGQPWRVGAAHALVRLGRMTQARDLADEALRYAHAWGAARHIGTALHARALTLGSRDRTETLTEAVSVLSTAPAPVELVEALTDLGRAQLALGQSRKGRTTLGEALELARSLPRLPEGDHDDHGVPRGTGELGEPAGLKESAGLREPAGLRDGAAVPRGVPTPRLIATVESALYAAVGHLPQRAARHLSCLSPAERRVVELAVQGLTNDQICASLHLARRTVETHLTRAYRKLGVTRRTQLAGRLAEGAAQR
ncbi:LuxR C-terminal-related transcriptional regulator, partial [Streptomyces sp. NPDC057638]|uniref:LuxR C-terminal-related transcriptional regulator n=1 Tax=Streptomyces sp. NPDC057638 TaxID=3346190 RepID=UPI00367B46D0